VPTPARPIPPIDPVKFAGELVDAVGEGIDAARHDIENPPPTLTPSLQTRPFSSRRSTSASTSKMPILGDKVGSAASRSKPSVRPSLPPARAERPKLSRPAGRQLPHLEDLLNPKRTGAVGKPTGDASGRHTE
jgi:hypothetical protein